MSALQIGKWYKWIATGVYIQITGSTTNPDGTFKYHVVPCDDRGVATRASSLNYPGKDLEEAVANAELILEDPPNMDPQPSDLSTFDEYGFYEELQTEADELVIQEPVEVDPKCTRCSSTNFGWQLPGYHVCKRCYTPFDPTEFEALKKGP